MVLGRGRHQLQRRTAFLDYRTCRKRSDRSNARLAAPPTTDWIEAEARDVHEFIDFHACIFFGRETISTELIEYCISPSTSAGLARCIIGGPGIGKSSLFSHLCRELNPLNLRQLRQRNQLRPEQGERLSRMERENVLLLGHAAGMSSRSTSIRDLLIRWTRELAQSLGQTAPVNESTGIDELEGTFDALLFRASESHRVILLLDGLNHFERTDRGKYLGWLPRVLPPNCRVLATANAGDESTEFERRGWQVYNLGPLDEGGIRTIFSAVCQRLYGRQGDLFEGVRKALVGKRDRAGQCAGGNPLWLRLALDLLNQLDEQTFSRQWTDPFRPLAPDARLNALLIDVISQMPGDVDQLYGWLLDRAEAVAGHFGQSSDARHFTSLIAVSQSGLREKDLKALLPVLTGEPWSDLRLSVLKRAFRAHLVRRGDLAQWDFSHAAWHFRSIIGMIDETAKNATVPEMLLLAQCQACQALATLLSTPVLLGLYQEAYHYLTFACSLVERQLGRSNPRDFRWSVLHTSLLLDLAALASGEPSGKRQAELLGCAQQAAEAIEPKHIQRHAIGVVALARSIYLKRVGEAATAFAEAQSSVAILKELHASFPSVIEPLQHLILAITELCISSNCPREIYKEQTADLEWLVDHLKRLSNGNEDLIPIPFRVVDSLFHVHYWAGVTDQVKSLIDSRDFERAELLAELAWQAMRNLARNGSWLPRGRHIEEHLCEVASHCLAIAALLHKGNADRLAEAMRRVAEAVGLSLVRDVPVDAGLREIYEMLLQAQPALREVETADDREKLRSGNASMLFEPTLRFDGTGWESCTAVEGERMGDVLQNRIIAHLGLLAMQTCMEVPLDYVNGSDIYQVPAKSWQAGEFLKYQEVCTVYDARAFEEAVQNPRVRRDFRSECRLYDASDCSQHPAAKSTS